MKLILILFFVTMNVVGVRGQDFAHADFSTADKMADRYAGYPLTDVHALAMNLTRSLQTEEEKFRALYKWVCSNIVYDYDLQLLDKAAKRRIKTTAERTAWRKSFSVLVLKTLREQRKTVCTGYAYLVRELAAQVGIDCQIVDGYCRQANVNVGGAGDPNHSWNAVRLHGRWYLCDATWSSGFVDDRFNFVQRYDGRYFLTDPAIFIRNHYPLDTAWTLLSHSKSLTEFLSGPLLYSTAFQYNVRPLAPAMFDVKLKKGETVFFEFQKGAELVINDVSFVIKSASIHEVVPAHVEQSGQGMCVTNYTFLKKGKFIFHILLNGAYAFTYSVRVS